MARINTASRIEMKTWIILLVQEMTAEWGRKKERTKRQKDIEKETK